MRSGNGFPGVFTSSLPGFSGADAALGVLANKGYEGPNFWDLKWL